MSINIVARPRRHKLRTKKITTLKLLPCWFADGSAGIIVLTIAPHHEYVYNYLNREPES